MPTPQVQLSEVLERVPSRMLPQPLPQPPLKRSEGRHRWRCQRCIAKGDLAAQAAWCLRRHGLGRHGKLSAPALCLQAEG